MQTNFKDSATYKSCIASASIVAKYGNLKRTYTKIDGNKFTRRSVEAVLMTLGWKEGKPLYFVQYGEGYYILKSKKFFYKEGGRYHLIDDKIYGFIGKDLADSFRGEPFCKFFDGFSTNNGDNYLVL